MLAFGHDIFQNREAIESKIDMFEIVYVYDVYKSHTRIKCV